MPSESLLFDLSDRFKVTHTEREGDMAFIFVKSLTKKAVCPGCKIHSKSIHSYYERTIKDLPAFGNKIYLRLKIRKFYCCNPECERKIFAERFDNHFASYKRTSNRLREKLLKIALLTGGNAGEKLCKTLNIPVSSSTLIRLIHQQEVPEPVVTEAVGIDDWAFKKGINYGTAVVDLKQHRIIDLLPDREAATVESWLKSRPHVKIVPRDRYSRYAKGVTNGLPEAIQVADRWHLLKNMGESLKKLLERKRQEMRRNDTISKPVIATNNPAAIMQRITNDQTRRQQQLDEVKRLHSSGLGIRKIAMALKMSRVTIRNYLHLDVPPPKNTTKTNIATFNEYIQQRMEEDKNIQVIQLWKEIKAKGYNGCRSVVYEYLKEYVNPQKKISMPDQQPIAWIPSKVSLLLYRKEEMLSKNERRLIKYLQNKSPDIRATALLSHKFRDIMENKQGHLLTEWIAEVERSPVRELKGFAKGLLNDYHAVKNALSLPWSNGQVEGQINKLKTVKRQMYGRASFSLLRKRLILSGGFST